MYLIRNSNNSISIFSINLDFYINIIFIFSLFFMDVNIIVNLKIISVMNLLVKKLKNRCLPIVVNHYLYKDILIMLL